MGIRKTDSLPAEQLTMIDLATARTIARDHVGVAFGDTITIVDERTRKETFGWAFFLQSTAHLRTGAADDMLVGVGPLVVDTSGLIYETDASESAEDTIRAIHASLWKPATQHDGLAEHARGAAARFAVPEYMSGDSIASFPIPGI